MFKKYDQKQQFLLPLDLKDFIPENHIASALNDIVDAVDFNAIESTYSKEGCPDYHPRPLLKILLYGYLIGIRSSRRLRQMTQTATFMYLAAMQKLDFHTFCRFRSTHLDPIKEIFSQVVTFCKEMDTIGSSISINLYKVENEGKTRKFRKSLFKYDEEKDCYYCPAAFEISFIRI